MTAVSLTGDGRIEAPVRDFRSSLVDRQIFRRRNSLFVTTVVSYQVIMFVPGVHSGTRVGGKTLYATI